MEIRTGYSSQLMNEYAESVRGTQATSEMSFLDFAAQAIKEGKISFAGQVESGNIGFNKAKFSFDKNVDLDQVKEEEVQNFLRKIQHILKNTEK